MVYVKGITFQHLLRIQFFYLIKFIGWFV